MKEKLKVYPSSIVPKGEKLEPTRDTKYTITSNFIEVVHGFVFLISVAFIFDVLIKILPKKKLKMPPLAPIDLKEKKQREEGP